ncbi:hypothetical protein ACG0Z6_00910 [Roseateles sp. BYS180W]|uniref:YqjK-like protein n=1 Tax=Roseateles rivi TaxID=3299028 RepID=A0ABW7FR32_9BURK
MWGRQQDLQRLALRQLELRLRCAQQRVQLAEAAQSLQQPLGWLDLGWRVAQLVRRAPLVWGSAGLWSSWQLLRQRARLARWVGVWRIGRQLWRWWRQTPPR